MLTDLEGGEMQQLLFEISIDTDATIQTWSLIPICTKNSCRSAAFNADSSIDCAYIITLTLSHDYTFSAPTKSLELVYLGP